MTGRFSSVARVSLALVTVIVVAVAATLAATLAPTWWRAAAARPASPGAAASVEMQPLAAQVGRLVEALDYIGAPLSAEDRQAIDAATRERDEAGGLAAIQRVLDRYVLFDVHINPESRVRVTAGAAPPALAQHGWRTFLVKVRNDAGVTATLKAESPQAQRVFARGAEGFSMDPRPKQTVTARDVADRWLDLSLFDKPPLTPALSGLGLEYRIIQLYSRDTGKREATVRFNVGQGTQDIGFRNDLPVLFTAAPAREITLRVLDEQNRPTTASFVIKDAQGHVYPSPAKRLAPDFAFHPQVYRADGERIALPAGQYTVEFTRGPEYVTQRQTLRVPEADASAGAGGGPGGGAGTGSSRDLDADDPTAATFRLQRWIDVPRLGWYSGDHHIHAAGCLHYETPTEGVFPQDMIRHILGEGLNVGAVLTWGPGYYFQKQFFEAKDHQLSTAEHRMHYDLEVSGFPSSHAGHLVLLGLKNQEYPGTKVLEDWPTWNLPILQWAKAQGAVVGYAHSGWGLEVASTDLPTREVPKFDGIGANEFIVDVAHDAVDFISTIDTPHTWELNIWYHTLNVGFRTRISGETDFPCIFGDRVGLGRSYVQLPDGLSYDRWVDGLRAGRAYVTDGKSHLLDFHVGLASGAAGGGTTADSGQKAEPGAKPAADANDAAVGGSDLRVAQPGTVRVTARVAARLEAQPTPDLRGRPIAEKPYWDLERARTGDAREVPLEVIVNGQPVARRMLPADGTLRDVSLDVPIERSSWVALRILPSSHTNPVFVILDGKPIRASRASAEWCLTGVDRCWQQKAPAISAAERPAAERAYEQARQIYRQRLAEADRD